MKTESDDLKKLPPKELLRKLQLREVEDYKKWTSMSRWTIEEAVALSLGLEPRQENLTKLPHYTHRLSMALADFAPNFGGRA